MILLQNKISMLTVTKTSLWTTASGLAILGGCLLLASAPLCDSVHQPDDVRACAVPKSQLGSWVTLFVTVTLLFAAIGVLLALHFAKPLKDVASPRRLLIFLAVLTALIVANDVTGIVAYAQCAGFCSPTLPGWGLGISCVSLIFGLGLAVSSIKRSY